MRLLAIDAGNSRIKWALFEGETAVESGASAYSGIEESAARWKTLSPDRIVGACVSGKEDLVGREFDIRWVRAAAFQCGVRNGYNRPEQLGPDRWAALVAARRRLPEGGIVAGFGTAMTLDRLDSEGSFPGGFIAPGLSLMLASLGQATRIDPGFGHFSASPVNTADAARSGAVLALAGAVEKLARSLGDPMCLIFGGDAAEIAPHINARTGIVDNLVLEGLSIIAADLWTL